MTAAVVVLALVVLLQTGGLIYFARAAYLSAIAAGASNATAAVAGEELREDDASIHQIDAARQASDARATALEKEASHASAVAPADGLARLRELDRAPTDPATSTGAAAGNARGDQS